MSLLTTSNSHLLALAPHTVSLVAEKLAAAGIQRSVDLFLPVFPIDLSCTQREKQARLWLLLVSCLHAGMFTRACSADVRAAGQP